MMGIIYDGKKLNIKMIIPDVLKENEEILYSYNTYEYIEKLNKKDLSNHLYAKLKEIEKNKRR